MHQVPPWILVLVAIWVIVFGVFRLNLARKKRAQRKDPNPDRPDFRRTGFYAQSARRHIMFGVLYLVLGTMLIAMSFGWKPPVLGGGCTDTGATATESGTTITVEPAPK